MTSTTAIAIVGPTSVGALLGTLAVQPKNRLLGGLVGFSLGGVVTLMILRAGDVGSALDASPAATLPAAP